MSDVMTLFIDGLPFDQLHKMPFTNTFASKARLVPILGYSVNCQTQLFTGKTPDEMGYWCEWTYDPDRAPFRKLKPLLKLAAPLERSYFLKRVMHKVLDRLRWVSCTKNIPLAYLGDFSETGHSVFSPWFRHESLLDLPEIHKIFDSHFAKAPQRDRSAFLAAKKYLQETHHPGSVVVTWTEIDYCSHWYGVDSEPYDRMLLENDEYIRELTQLFLEKARDGVVFVVSDHGMANVTHPIHIELEKKFGKPQRGTYAYFSEGTLLRVWSDNLELRARLLAYLDDVAGLERVSEEERRQFGITNPAFGHWIYHAQESAQLVPSYWGPKPSVGMHGYHPRYRSQHGVCLSSQAGAFASTASALDFYRVLSGYFKAPVV